MKTNRMLMSVAALALLAASPALAESANNKGVNAGADTQINTPVGSASVTGSTAIAPTGSASTSGQAALTVSELDTNGDGTISKSEYDAAASEQGAQVQQFAQLDTNRDGKLSSAELKATAKVRTSNQ